MANYNQIANDVIDMIGGKENIEFAAHCMTRLRLTLKEESKVDEEGIKKIKGVLGLNKVGKQYQIIIGQTVDKVYKELCAEAGIGAETPVAENLDAPKEKLTVKKVFGNILDYISASVFSVTPILMVAGLFRCITVICGSNMLNIIADESELAVLLNAVYNAGFYFLPIYVGYTSAKKIGMTPVLGMLVGGLLIEPSLLAIAASEAPAFHVYGIPTTLYDYTSTIMPVILSVWFVSYVEKFFKKYLPAVLRTSFAPFLTFVVSVPAVLLVLAPSGTIISNAICDGVFAFYDAFGIVALVLMCAFGILLTITGMHVALGTISAIAIITTQYDPFFFVAGILSNFTIMGMCLGSVLALKKKANKSEAMGYLIASSIGGVTEPGLYGLAMRYKKPFLGLFAGGAAAGLYAGLTNTYAHMFPPASNFLAAIAFFGDTRSSVVNAVITCVIGFAVSTVVTYLFGYRNVEEA